MNEFLFLAVPLATGLVLGALFFGGLWWTVGRALSSPQPALWFLASKLLRTAVVLGGFYEVGGGRWERWLLCLAGFVLSRLLISGPTGSPARSDVPQASGPRYAP